MEIIAKVDDPTDWISSMVVTTKRNGKVRLCIDPKALNNALKRSHYPLPSTEDVLPLLSDAKLFTVLDAATLLPSVLLGVDIAGFVCPSKSRLRRKSSREEWT